MKALTFLGTGNYESSHYRLDGKEVETNLFPLALPQLCPSIAEVIVFVTQQARDKHFKTLEESWQERHGSKPTLKPVDIPAGRSEEEYWEIFQILADQVAERETIVLDITHSFRSLPLIGLLVAAYLKAAREVTLQALLYGAYEARNEDANTTPVFDLTPMAALLDWTAALQRFNTTWDASGLAQLVGAIQADAHRDKAPDAPTKLKHFAKTLDAFGEDLRLGRIQHVTQQAPRILCFCDDTHIADEAGKWARPLKLVLPIVRQATEPISDTKADELDTHLKLARLYYGKGLHMQAISLLREWIVSKTIQAATPGENVFDREQNRKPAEAFLNYHADKKAGIDNGFDKPDYGDNIEPEMREALIRLWSQVRQTRNEIDHLGFNLNPAETKSLTKSIAKCLKGAERL